MTEDSGLGLVIKYLDEIIEQLELCQKMLKQAREKEATNGLGD